VPLQLPFALLWQASNRGRGWRDNASGYPTSLCEYRQINKNGSGAECYGPSGAWYANSLGTAAALVFPQLTSDVSSSSDRGLENIIPLYPNNIDHWTKTVWKQSLAARLAEHL
jgi:hypothetical protein